MRSISRFLVALSISICVATLSGAAQAQDNATWFGAEVVDVTKAEADKLGWDAPHGAKVARMEPGSPATRAGLKVGDIILTLDRTELDGASDFTSRMDSTRPGAELRLRVLSGKRVIGLVATLDKRVADAPILELDTGGHMALVRSVAFLPDGQRIISAGNDKTIRITDRQTGRTVRVIRGQSGLGQDGMLFALAASPKGTWVAVGGALGTSKNHIGDIRIFDLRTGKLVDVLIGHTDVVNSLAVSPDGSRLVSASGAGDLSAIIWDVASKKALHRLRGHKDAIGGVAFTPDGTHVVTRRAMTSW
jgi:WD40 repeat protein